MESIMKATEISTKRTNQLHQVIKLILPQFCTLTRLLYPICISCNVTNQGTKKATSQNYSSH